MHDMAESARKWYNKWKINNDSKHRVVLCRNFLPMLKIENYNITTFLPISPGLLLRAWEYCFKHTNPKAWKSVNTERKSRTFALSFQRDRTRKGKIRTSKKLHNSISSIALFSRVLDGWERNCITTHMKALECSQELFSCSHLKAFYFFYQALVLINAILF